MFTCREFRPWTGWDGIGSYVLSLGPALVDRGHEVHVLSCLEGHPHRDYTERGIHFHLRGEPRIRGAAKLQRMSSTSRRVRTALITYGFYLRLRKAFDIIEFPDWGAEGLLFALSHRIPLVAHLHTPLRVLGEYSNLHNTADFRWACALERWAVEHADMVVSPSELLLDRLAALRWLGRAHCEVVPNPVDWPAWNNVGSASRTTPIVLYVGRLDTLKAPERVVEAMKVLRKEFPHVQALFVGTSGGLREGMPYGNWVKKLASNVGGCEFVDAVPRWDLPSFYERARVVVVPSQFESFSMVAAEAMASGRAVVVTEANGIAGLVAEQGIGKVVRSAEPELLAEALRPFVASPLYASEMGIKAREVVRSRLDPIRIAVRIEAVYRKAIQIHQGG